MSETVRPGRRIVVWTAGLVLAAAVATLAAVLAWLPGDDEIRRRVERTLGERFDSDVQLQAIRVSLFPALRVEGEGLTLTWRARRGAPPLIAVARFRADAGWRDVFARPRRVRHVGIEGLRVTISPGPGTDRTRGTERGGCQGERRHATAGEARPSPVLVESLSAPGTELVLLPRDPGKQPRRYSIHALTLHDVTLDAPLRFEAVVTNPVPRGLVSAQGRFGPWVTADPGLSSIEGDYSFDRADMGTIRGLGGTLASKGRFTGVLQQILVSGTATVPDFSLDTARHPLRLETRFDTCVDGTDGDTYLDSVEAELGSTPILARGRIEGHVGVEGRTIALDVVIDQGRVEDVLALAVRAEAPVMTGGLSLKTQMLVPPGPSGVVNRLELDGEFGLHQARFTGRTVQAKIDELSRRGRGRPQDATVGDVTSDFRGRFTLSDGVLRLPSLAFAVPGARVVLRGDYGLVSERMAFAGTVRLQAPVSRVTTGVASTVLKVVDPLFAREDAGTVLPIHITGTRERPQFGVDMKGALTRSVK